MRQSCQRLACLVFMAAGLVCVTAADGAAQALGTFRWQLQPYCNVITLNVTGQGAVFTLDGFDDQCGASQRASVVGTAFFNPDGTVGIGLNAVLAPGGAFVHVEARIGLTSLTGPWRDSAGNTGSFVFTPGTGIGGGLRPVPINGIQPASITAAQLAPGAIGSGQIDPNQVQVRIAGTCPVGQYLRGIHPNGAVVCEPLAPPVSAYLTADSAQITLPSSGQSRTVAALRGLPPGRYLVTAHATAVHTASFQANVRCAIRGAGQDSYGVWGSPASVGITPGATWFTQVVMSLPVTASEPFDVEMYCSASAAQPPAAYVEEVRLHAMSVNTLEVRPPAQ
jgi:hypothetical protein